MAEALVPAMPEALATVIAEPFTLTAQDRLYAFQLLSGKDQEIGRLRCEIMELERHMMERGGLEEQIQDQLLGTQQDIRHLQLDLDYHQQKLEEHVKRNQELEDENKRLLAELEYKNQELKHNAVELETAATSAAAISGNSSTVGTPGSRGGSSIGSSLRGPPLSGSISLALRSPRPYSRSNG